MAWRSVMIQNPANLSLHRGQIRLRNDDGECTLPVEDITAIILESPQITLTAALLSACHSNGVAIITCDATHMPNGVSLPFQPHSRQSRMAHIQISWTDSLKSRLWQRVVQCKIDNQARCIETLSTKESAKRLYALSQRVKSGDPDNIEAQAAREYWPLFMGNDFRRGNENHIINAALNYGYAVVRAYMARAQVSFGLIPAFGIHHDNNLNAFNLTDDIMEVFRPMVDYHVRQLHDRQIINTDDTNLSSMVRQELANIGNHTCLINGKYHTIANACDQISASLVCAIENKKPSDLSLPFFIKGKVSE